MKQQDNSVLLFLLIIESFFHNTIKPFERMHSYAWEEQKQFVRFLQSCLNFV